MAKIPLPKRRIKRVFAGIVAGTVALTFGIMVKGVLPDGYASAESSEEAPDRAPPPVRSASPISHPAIAASPPAAPSPSARAFAVKRILKIDGSLRHGDYVWDDAGIPPGPIVITIDLKAETLSVFRGGYEIGVAAILYGATDKPSPLGVFPVMEKDADHVSNLYDAPMPYMLRLTNDGVAIHGSEVEWGRATHGCIGVPTPFARKLFSEAKVGDIVIITSGKTMSLG